MKVYTVTHTEHGWDNILAVFLTKEAATEYVGWYAEYCETPKDVMIVHTNNLHEEFNKENFE